MGALSVTPHPEGCRGRAAHPRWRTYRIIYGFSEEELRVVTSVHFREDVRMLARLDRAALRACFDFAA